MYGADFELDREVINYWHLGWEQIFFIANNGVQTDLKDWKMRMANDPHAYARFRSSKVRNTPVKLSPLQLFKFFRKYEPQIWEGAEQMGQELEGNESTALKFIGGLNGADRIRNLNDIGILAAKWSVEEVCQRIYQDWEEYHESEEEGEFRDIWEPTPEHEEMHTDVGAYDESQSVERVIRANVVKEMAEEVDASIMRRLGN